MNKESNKNLWAISSALTVIGAEKITSYLEFSLMNLDKHEIEKVKLNVHVNIAFNSKNHQYLHNTGSSNISILYSLEYHSCIQQFLKKFRPHLSPF